MPFGHAGSAQVLPLGVKAEIDAADASGTVALRDRGEMVKKVFLCGIAGTGMSALAGLFKEQGYEVYGSDSRFYPPVDRLLADLRVTLFQGFSAKNIPADVDFCVIGNAISRGNPEAEAILDRRLEYFSMAEALQQFFHQGQAIRWWSPAATARPPRRRSSPTC